jgi:hypothetical protein
MLPFFLHAPLPFRRRLPAPTPPRLVVPAAPQRRPERQPLPLVGGVEGGDAGIQARLGLERVVALSPILSQIRVLMDSRCLLCF